MARISSIYRKASIKTKVTITVLVTVSLLMVALSWNLYIYVHNMMSRSIMTQQTTLATEISEQLNGRIELARHQLTLASAEIDSQSLTDAKKLHDILTQLSPVQIIFDAGLLVIGNDGRVIAENMGHPQLVGSDLNPREFVSRALASGATVISAPFRSSIAPHRPMIAMVVPVRDSSDRIICLLAGYHSLGTEQFLTSLSSKRLGAGSYLYLIQGRTILMHPDRARILEPIPAGMNPGIDRALQGFEGSLENVNSKGQHMLSSFKQVGQTGWILGANIPYDEAFKPLSRLAFNAGIISAFGILLSLGVVWLVTRRLTQPIMHLIDLIDRATCTGATWSPLNIKTGDEIERLADVFNTMMTEVCNSRQVLADEKEFYSGIIQHTAAPMFVINSKHTILFWNNALTKLTGKSSFQMKNTKQQWTPFYASKRPVLADLVIDHKLGLIDEFYANSETSRFVAGAYQAEGWFENIGGRRRYLLFVAAPIMNSRNEIVAAVETLEDITERKLAEEAMASHNLFLQEILDAIPNPVFYKDTTGAYIGCNKAFQDFIGLGLKDVVGKTIADIMPGTYAEKIEQYDNEVIGARTGLNYEGEMRSYDGRERKVLMTKAPFFTSSGELAGIVGAFVDITDRKAIEAELAKSRQELEANHSKLEHLFAEVAHGKREWEETLDHLRDFIILTDTESRIRRCNRILADSTSRTINELVGMDWRELIDEAGFSFVTFNGTSGEISHRGSGRSYDITVYSIEDDGRFTGNVVSLNDTTDLRATTQELEKAYAELKEVQLQIFQQEKMASIGQLAAGVAHEINNPMGFISSNLGTLKKYIDRLAEFITASDQSLAAGAGSMEAEKLKDIRKRLKVDYILDDSRQLIAESQDGAGRVRRIVQDLKSFSRVDQAERGLINLNEALETTINIAWNEIKYVATLNREFGDIPEILCYPQQLNQVFLNLLVNAAHAIGENQGIITVRTWNEGTDVLVSVSDSGCGIPEENRQRIFEPFFTTKEVGKGTGLGLSISYDIVRKHGGEMHVESEVGHGTTFIVRLPVSGSKEQE